MADTSDDLRQLARELCEHPPEYFSLDALHEAARLASDNPAALTDRHLRHIAVYEPRTVAALLQKRADAQQADRDAAEHRRAAQTPAPTPDPPAVDFTGVKTFDELAKRFPDLPVTVAMMADVVHAVRAMNERHTARHAAIEQRAADLAKQLTDLRVELDALIMVRS